MNINSNELLLLKKIRFAGEGGNADKSNGVTTTTLTTEPEQTQTAMNKLMFQGLKNVVSDPKLAQEIDAFKNTEVQPKEDGTEKEYVAPYKSNLAFQGKAGKVKTYLTAAMMALAPLAASNLMTSCVNVEQYAEIDASMFASMISELQALRQEIADSNKQMAERLDKIIKMFTDFMEMYKQNSLDEAKFRAIVLANQDILISIMRENGKTEQESKEAIEKILAEVMSGNKTVQQGIEDLKNLLTDIKGLLGQIISDLKEYADRASEERQNLIDTNKKGFEELIQRGDITNETLKNMQAQNDSIIVLSNKQIEAQEDIKAAIEKANMDSNANFETVVKTLNVNKNELISAMMRLGYTQAQIIRMSAGDIIKAIDKNTEVTKQGNALLLRITKQLMILPKLLQQGMITNIQLNNFYKLYQEATADGAEFNAELLAKLEDLAKQLENIQMTLDQILDKLGEHYGSDPEVLDYLKEINNNLKDNNDKTDSTNEVLNKLYELVEKNGTNADALGKQILNYIAAFGFETNQNFKKVLAAINTGNQGSGDIKALLEKVLANQDKNTKAIIDAIGNLEVNGGGSVDLSSLERMVAELLAQAKKNGNILSDINAKQDVLNATTKSILDNLEKEFGKNDIRYENINNILNVISNKVNGKDDQELLDKLDKVLAKMDEIKDAIKNHKVEVDITGKITCECNCGNHEGILKDLEDILGE